MNDGELLVLRRTLNGHMDANHAEQRENIFHTWCTINCHICSLIVDGGSYTNVASTTLVEKLKIKIEGTPNLTLFNGSTKVKDYKFPIDAWFSFALVKAIMMDF